MALPGKNSDLFRRVKFYGFGLLMGILLVSVLTRGKACQLPSTTKLDELTLQKLEYSQHAECRMRCRHITEAEIQQVFKSGKINYDKSSVHDKPYPTYAIEGPTGDGKKLRIVIADVDTISRIVTTIDLKNEADSCDCK